MAGVRQHKIEALIQRELGNYFLRETAMRYNGAMISVTTVRLTADLALARVYISIFGGGNRDEIFQMVVHNTREIRMRFAASVKNQLRFAPEMEFRLDDSIEYADRIDKLLKGK